MGAIQITVNKPHPSQANVITNAKRFNILKIGRRWGKALSLSTPILTQNRGWVTMGTIKVGDIVFTPSGRPTKVTFKSDVEFNKECYKLTFSDKSAIIADADHLWITKTKKTSTNNKIKTTKDISQSLIYKSENNHKIPVCEPLFFECKKLPLHPYLLGVWLGDGQSSGTCICSDDIEIIDKILSLGYFIRATKAKYTYSLTCRATKKGIGIKKALQELNLIKNKHIPNIYLCSSINDRFDLLRGLMDTDGYSDVRGSCEYTTIREGFAKDVLNLCLGLGIKASLYVNDATINGRFVSKKYRVRFCTDKEIFTLPRKRIRNESSKKSNQSRIRSIISCIPVPSEPVVCIKVKDKDGMFLAGTSLIATHNTSLAVHKLMRTVALDGNPVAYFAPTYTDISEVWNELKFILAPVIRSKNETTKQIRLITDGVIDFWSMDNPDSGRGRKYKRVIVDEAEKAGKFEEAWQNTILPTLIDLKGDAWILSTPKFGQTYFKRLFNDANDRDNWARFNLSSYDNPYLDKTELEEIRKTMDELSFRCEILAEDVDLVNNPFCYAFDESKHVKPVTYDPFIELCAVFDFNKDPLTAVCWQNPEMGVTRAVREYRLMNGDIEDLCDRIIADYPDALWLITGDATGANRSALVKGNTSYYTVIKQRFGLTTQQIKTPSVNPSIRDTRVLLNSMLQNGVFEVDPSCTYLIKDLKYVQVDDKGDIIKDRKDGTREADFIDITRYNVNTFHRKWLKIFTND